MSTEPKHTPKTHQATQDALDIAENKRVAARRRFLRTGASGSAALIMTVTHKRSFAGGIKKGVLASNCTSLKGIADLTGTKHKTPLEVSAMGTPKNLICRHPDNPQPVGNCAEIYPSRYVDVNGNTYLVADGDELNKGCGNLQLTVQRSQNYRLYGLDKVGGKAPGRGEGSGGEYCPIAFDANGDLNYVQKNYYKIESDGRIKLEGACKPAPLP